MCVNLELNSIRTKQLKRTKQFNQRDDLNTVCLHLYYEFTWIYTDNLKLQFRGKKVTISDHQILLCCFVFISYNKTF